MALIVGNDTYDRWILEPDDELDAEVEFAQIEAFQAEESEDAKRISKAAEALKKARLARIEEGKKVTVTFKPLRARDKAELEDSVRIGDDDGRQVRPGEMRMLSVKRAVVKWDASPPWTEAIADNLHPDAFESIYGWISFGVVPPEQDEFGDPIQRQLNRAERRAAAKTERPSRQRRTPEPAASGS